MIHRYTALQVICAIQVLIGWLVIGAGATVLIITLTNQAALPIPVQDSSAIGVALIIFIGAVLLGINLIAMANVFQCLMQIEINTRNRA